MIFYSIKPFLFLRTDSSVFNLHAIALLSHRSFLNINIQIHSAFHHFFQLLCKFLYILITKYILHISGSCFCTIFIISICGKQIYHRLNIIKDLSAFHSLCSQNPQLWIVSKASGAVDIKSAIFPCSKSKISESSMRQICRRIRKTYFQFSRKFYRFNQSHKIICSSLCIWRNIKILTFFYTGKR